MRSCWESSVTPPLLCIGLRWARYCILEKHNQTRIHSTILCKTNFIWIKCINNWGVSTSPTRINLLMKVPKLLKYSQYDIFRLIAASCECSHTGGVWCQEASRADADVGAQFDIKLISSGVDGGGRLTATQPGQFWRTSAVSIIYLRTHRHKA